MVGPGDAARPAEHAAHSGGWIEYDEELEAAWECHRDRLRPDLARLEAWGEERYQEVYAGSLLAPPALDDSDLSQPNHVLHLFVVESSATAPAVAELTRELSHPAELCVHRAERSFAELEALLDSLCDEVDHGRWGQGAITSMYIDVGNNAVAVGVVGRDEELIRRLREAHEALVFYEGFPGEEVRPH